MENTPVGEMESIIAVVKADDLAALRSHVRSGLDLDAVDENGWTALCWAASRGYEAAVDVLCEAGADVFKTAEDLRTPYKIALAAAHVPTARRLREIELATDPEAARASSLETEGRSYCKAYPAEELLRFPQWSQLAIGHSMSTGESLFIHEDYVVTRSIWHEQDVVLNSVTPQWRAFCEQSLGFKVPDALDLATQRA